MSPSSKSSIQNSNGTPSSTFSPINELTSEVQQLNEQINDESVNINHVLMNPDKVLTKTYSVVIDSAKICVVDLIWIEKMYDAALKWSVAPQSSVFTRQMKSKVNAILPPLVEVMKSACRLAEWPNLMDKPSTSSTDWSIWKKTREDKCKVVSNAIRKKYNPDCGTFHGTISGIYNKLNPPTTVTKKASKETTKRK